MLIKKILLFTSRWKELILLFFIGFLVLSIIIFNLSLPSQNLISFKNKINVVEKTDFSLDYNCEKMDCLKAYYDFSENHQQYKKEITEKELEKQIKEISKERERIQFTPTSEELKRAILKILNIEFLVENINKRELMVTTIAEIDKGNYIEKELLFEDKHVGIFDVLLLTPKNRNKNVQLPAIIGLHGHGDSNRKFRDDYMGIDLVQQGFIVIMPSFRAMDGKQCAEISKKLILNGFTLMGIRVYETLLLAKYLQYFKMVDNDRIGIISHSGGSSCANLVARITDSLRAQVTDYYVSWLDSNAEIHDEIIPHDEVIPPLAYYREAINNNKSLPIPILSVPYSFENKKKVILDFVLSHL